MTGVIPWKIKKGRPSAIPGCQNVKELSDLSENEKCEEGAYCYNYRCKKCWPYLILDYFNLQHEEKIVIIPEISNLQPKTKGIFDDDDYGYLGEVLEFYQNYLSRVNGISGVAINGWDNELAESVFDFVGDTFKNTKNGSSRNFEIDWIILNGDSVTVVEVGMRGKTQIREGNENCLMNEEKDIQGVIDNKFKQIVKNQTIVEHLLEATGNQHILVKYLAFFPNISITSVQSHLDKMQQIARREGRKSSIDELVASKENIQFGIITTECIAPKCVHLYLGQGKLDEPTELANTLRLQSQKWTENYRHLTSLLAASWQMPPKCISTKSTNGSLPREIKETRKTVGWEPRKGLKFPKDLILGQEQLEVMKCAQNFNSHDDARITFLIGEAGCGKTTTLLALLFKYTGKHVSEKKLRNVVFFVPEGKTEFRKYVKQFIEDHCNGEWVQLIPLHCMQSECLSPEKIYLVDEFYGSSQDLLNFVEHATCTFYVASVSVKTGFVSFAVRDKHILRNFYFRRVYRSPEALSRISSKLRRLMDRDDDDDAHLNIPWAMSFFNGAPTSLRNPIEVTAFTDTVLPILENLSLDSKRSLLVTLECDQQIVSEIDQKFLVATKYHLTHQTKCVEEIPFTGSEFDNVAIFLAENVECSWDLVLVLLHSAISRATSKVFIVCHQRDKKFVTSMLSLEGNNDVIFERLRYSSNVYSGNLDEMRDPKDRLELLKRLIVTRNESRFKSLKLSYDESKLTNGERDLIKWTSFLGKLLLSEDFQILFDGFNTLDKLSSIKVSGISSFRPYLNVFPNCDVRIPENFKKRWFKLTDCFSEIHILQILFQ